MTARSADFNAYGCQVGSYVTSLHYPMIPTRDALQMNKLKL